MDGVQERPSFSRDLKHDFESSFASQASKRQSIMIEERRIGAGIEGLVDQSRSSTSQKENEQIAKHYTQIKHMKPARLL